MWNSCGRGNEHARAQPRESTHTYTVAENAHILPTFMPEKQRDTKSHQPHGDARHPSTSASQR